MYFFLHTSSFCLYSLKRQKKTPKPHITHLVTCLWKSVSCLCVTVTAPTVVSFGKPFKEFSNHRQKVCAEKRVKSYKRRQDLLNWTLQVITKTHRFFLAALVLPDLEASKGINKAVLSLGLSNLWGLEQFAKEGKPRLPFKEVVAGIISERALLLWK